MKECERLRDAEDRRVKILGTSRRLMTVLCVVFTPPSAFWPYTQDPTLNSEARQINFALVQEMAIREKGTKSLMVWAALEARFKSLREHEKNLTGTATNQRRNCAPQYSAPLGKSKAPLLCRATYETVLVSYDSSVICMFVLQRGEAFWSTLSPLVLLAS